MGVNIWEGKKAERVVTALETMASMQSASDRAAQAALDAREAAERAEQVVQDIADLADNIETLENILEQVEPTNIGAVAFEEQTLTSEQKTQARANIDAISANDVDSLVTGVVKYTVPETELTPAQKNQARTNIGAAASTDLDTVLRYTEQSLTEQQKLKARENIGAVSSDEVTGVVKYSEQQLTNEQKTQARTNIGAISAQDVNPLVEGVVKYSEQSLTNEQKQQARTNIGAVAASEVSDLATGNVKYSQQSLELQEQAQARTNIGAASSSEVSTIRSSLNALTTTVSQMNDNVSDITKIDSGVHVSYANGESKDITLDVGSELASVNYDANYYLHFLDKNGDELYEGPFFIQGGGGGSSSAGTATISRVTDSPYSCVYGQPAVIQFRFTATDSGGETVGNGVGMWSVGGVTVARNISVAQGLNQFDIGPYLTAGENNIRLTVNVDVGGDSDFVVKKTWTVNAVNMRFVWNYNDAQINTGEFLDSWTVYGDVEKTTHTRIDGTEIESVTTTKSNATQSVRIPMQLHGAHKVERWVSATNNNIPDTPIQSHEMIFAVEGVEDPIIAVSLQNNVMNQYDTVRIPVVVYDPKTLLANASLYIDGTQVGTWTGIDRSVQYWVYTPSQAGQHTLTIICGETEKNITITVNEIVLDVEEVPGYSFKFKSSEFAANEAVKTWNSNGITATFSENFDWINGGLHTETDEKDNIQQYFCVKAGTSMTIHHELFATDPKSNGMNYKIIFKTTNCRNYDAEIAHCYSGVGFRMYAHQAIFNSSGTTITVPYGEDEYTELEFDVYPAPVQENDGNVRYMMAWLDGVITSCRVYGETDIFTQPALSREEINIGSADCDIYIYLIKAYGMLDKGNNFDNHIANFIMDAPNASEMAARYNRNDIVDTDSGEISYEKLMAQNKDLRIWLYDIPYFTNAKDDKVSGCKFKQFWENGSQYYQLEGEGKMSVQGTSSVNYIRGAANTDINFSVLKDGNGNNLLDGGTKDETYGNNWYVENEENPGHAKVFIVQEDEILGPECVPVERDENKNVTKYIKALGFKINDDSCPITYSNTKVNFASCEQVNNMCNAIWYQRYNPYPSLTPRDCMEFSIGVQFIKDSGTIPDDKHFVLFGDNKYHMYSIANMGNSKKNVHVFHDLSNPNEVCIEVNDNDKDQMRMVSDDLTEENWDGKKFFGMRYPDTKNPSQEIRNAWQRLVTWMATNNPNAATGEELSQPETYTDYTFRGHDRDGLQVLRGTTVTQYSGTYTHDTFKRRIAKMLNECEDYMVMDSFVYHFTYLERHTMVDNVCKNNFWSSSDLIHWGLSKAYDMDTSDGNNNQGQLVFDYGLEYNDTNPVDLKKVFNGSDSVWFVFVANLYEACRTMFVNREAAGAWSATAYHNFLLSEQRKVPERCWIQTYWYDYLRTYENNISGEWMSFLDGGQKTHQRKHYETYQELYDSSKYRGSASTSQNINLRAYTPAQWSATVTASPSAPMRAAASSGSSLVTNVPTDEIVYISEKTNELWRKVTWRNYEGYMMLSSLDAMEPKGELIITMYNKMYISVDVGTTALAPVKAERGVPYVISFDQGGLTSNTVIAINTAPMVQAISGFERLYPDTCVFDAAVRLRELTIGSSAPGYVNTNLQRLSLENNRMLERLYIQNQPNATSVLNLSKCPALTYVDATGSGFTGYEFADGGLLQTAILEAPTSLNMRNLSYLTDENLTINDYSKLISVRLENLPYIDTFNIVNNAVNLQIARLIAIDWELETSSILDRLYRLQGYNEAGITVDKSVLTGDTFVPVMRLRNLEMYNTAWPELDITYTSTLQQYAFHFYNKDGTPLKDRYGEDYVEYVDRGTNLDDTEVLATIDPVLNGDIDTPTTSPDAQYYYTFSGWNNMTGTVLNDRNITAQYSTEERSYTVRWMDGQTVLKSVSANYGTEVVYSDTPYDYPTKTSEEDLFYYNVFEGWDKSTGFITEDTDVHAIWNSAELPGAGEKDLSEMGVAEIYGVAKRHYADNYWEPEDYIDINVGHDFNFSNVESEVLLSNTYFDGTSIIRKNDIQLFSEDAPSFTMAIDYEFADDTNDGTLVSCYDSSGSEGFRLHYVKGSSESINITWGDKEVPIASGFNRGIVVIRHRKGSRNLYIASDNGGRYVYHSASYSEGSEVTNRYSYDAYNSEAMSVESPRAQDTSTSSVLSFGGTARGTIGSANLGKGWVYWCKIWYEDLGIANIHQLATWPHETWRMHYRGCDIYDMQNETGLRDGASFVANALLPQYYEYYNTNQNGTTGGWSESQMRTFMGRCYDALPIGWQIIIQSAYLTTKTGQGGVNPTEITVDKLYLPARVDMESTIQSPFANEGTTIPWFINNSMRVKFMGITIPEDAQIITDASDDPTLYDTYHIKAGDVWMNNNVAYIYVDATTASKHAFIGGRPKTDAANLSASGAQGGLWVRAASYWTRTPSDNVNGYYHYGVGVSGSVDMHYIYYSDYRRKGVLLAWSI